VALVLVPVEARFGVIIQASSSPSRTHKTTTQAAVAQVAQTQVVTQTAMALPVVSVEAAVRLTVPSP